MRAGCERCATSLAPDGDAVICSFECTFCGPCGTEMDGTCPNCGGAARGEAATVADGLSDLDARAGGASGAARGGSPRRPPRRDDRGARSAHVATGSGTGVRRRGGWPELEPVVGVRVTPPRDELEERDRPRGVPAPRRLLPGAAGLRCCSSPACSRASRSSCPAGAQQLDPGFPRPRRSPPLPRAARRGVRGRWAMVLPASTRLCGTLEIRFAPCVGWTKNTFGKPCDVDAVLGAHAFRPGSDSFSPSRPFEIEARTARERRADLEARRIDDAVDLVFLAADDDAVSVIRSTPLPSVSTRWAPGSLNACRYSSWKQGRLQSWRYHAFSFCGRRASCTTGRRALRISSIFSKSDVLVGRQHRSRRHPTAGSAMIRARMRGEVGPAVHDEVFLRLRRRPGSR